MLILFANRFGNNTVHALNSLDIVTYSVLNRADGTPK